ncbi:fasciclin [Sphingomonas sp. Leaf17]|nr:fasciclin [Sphingomonas sp. Leaf17]
MLALSACGRTTSSETAATPSTSAAPNATTAPMAPNPAVGGAAMLATNTIVANASMAPNLTTLVAAVKAADLVTTLSGPGPFTVFAPTNEAFSRLAPGTVDNLLKPENRPTLVKVLTYHVVPGTLSSAILAQQIAAGGGTATLTTVEGEPLTVTMTGDVFTLTDVSGNKSYIETPDVRQSNGMVHVVNGVVIPKIG